MQLYFHSENNVGDQLNSWIWDALFNAPVSSLEPKDSLLIGIGTILRESIPKEPKTKFVLGSGCGYEAPPKLTSDWNVVMVRGHLTAGLMGLGPQAVVADPGILVRDFYQKSTSATEVGFMPHYSSSVLCDWESLCRDLGLLYIDASLPIDLLMQRLTRCRLLIAEAMHGAIMADALGIKWIAVKTRSSILDFKWQDWASALKMNVNFKYLAPPYRNGIKRALAAPLLPWSKRQLRKLADEEGMLSDRDVLDDVCYEMHRRIASFKALHT